MANKPKPPTRFQKARSLIALDGVKIDDVDEKGRLKSAFVNGSQAKTYYVILKRNPGIIAECQVITSNGNLPCPSSKYTICYHVLATIIKAAQKSNREVAFCKTEEDADRRANIGGQVYKLISEREGGENPLWVVCNPSD